MIAARSSASRASAVKRCWVRGWSLHARRRSAAAARCAPRALERRPQRGLDRAALGGDHRLLGVGVADAAAVAPSSPSRSSHSAPLHSGQVKPGRGAAVDPCRLRRRADRPRLRDRGLGVAPQRLADLGHRQDLVGRGRRRARSPACSGRARRRDPGRSRGRRPGRRPGRRRRRRRARRRGPRPRPPRPRTSPASGTSGPRRAARRSPSARG